MPEMVAKAGNRIKYNERSPETNTMKCYWLDEREHIQHVPYIKVLQSRAVAIPTMKSVRVLMRHIAALSGKTVRSVLLEELEPYYHNDRHWEHVEHFVGEVYAEHIDTLVANRLRGRQE